MSRNIVRPLAINRAGRLRGSTSGEPTASQRVVKSPGDTGTITHVLDPAPARTPTSTTSVASAGALPTGVECHTGRIRVIVAGLGAAAGTVTGTERLPGRSGLVVNPVVRGIRGGLPPGPDHGMSSG